MEIMDKLKIHINRICYPDNYTIGVREVFKAIDQAESELNTLIQTKDVEIAEKQLSIDILYKKICNLTTHKSIFDECESCKALESELAMYKQDNEIMKKVLTKINSFIERDILLFQHGRGMEIWDEIKKTLQARSEEQEGNNGISKAKE